MNLMKMINDITNQLLLQMILKLFRFPLIYIWEYLIKVISEASFTHESTWLRLFQKRVLHMRVPH